MNVNDSLPKTTAIEKNENISDSLQERLIPKLRFFPEGGYMIQGIPSKIGIKALDQFENDLDIKGLLKDSEDNTVNI